LNSLRPVLIINVILESMIAALRRGDDVEFPFGKLQRVKRHYSEYWDYAGDSQANRDAYTVRRLHTETTHP
jgi:hypothetical protein